MQRVFLVYGYNNKDFDPDCDGNDVRRVRFLMGIFYEYEDAYKFAEEYSWQSDAVIEIEVGYTYKDLQDNTQLVYKGTRIMDDGKAKLEAIYLNMEYN